MDDIRSKSYNDERMNNHNNTYNDYRSSSSTHVSDNGVVGPNYKSSSNPSGMQDLRCYSASYASSSSAHNNNNNGVMDIVVADGGEQWKFKKGKSMNGMGSLKSWSFNDPELQRKKRVATYKAYTVEGKVKGSFKKSFRWLKHTYTRIIYGHNR